MITTVIILFIFILLSAFFSGTETAYFNLKSHRNDIPEKIKDLLSKPSTLLVSILTGNTIINVAIGSFATLTILMKNSLMENLSQDYVRTAFAKGLAEKRVIFFHAVRNSLIPLATGIGNTIGLFLAGSYLIEKIFGIDGIGLLTFQAIGFRDYGIIMGFLVIGILIRLFGNLISDLVYAMIDPRIRFK